jgi:hypothetical protein
MLTDDHLLLLKNLDDAIIEAAKFMDLADVNEDSDDYDTVWEDRYHCGTCVVRSVMEVVWPSIDELITSLENEIARLNEVATKGASQ